MVRMPGEKGGGFEWMSARLGVEGPRKPPMRVNVLDTISVRGAANGEEVEFV